MSGVGQNVRDFAEENTYVQRSAKKFFCFAKHDPGNARQKFTQPGKRNLADICNCIGALATSEGGLAFVSLVCISLLSLA